MSPSKPHEEHEIMIREIFGSSLCRNRSLIVLGNTWAVVGKRYTCTLSNVMTWDATALDASIVRNVWCSVPDAL